MIVLFLTNTTIISDELLPYLLPSSDTFVFSNDKIYLKDLKKKGIDFIVSYNYHYIIRPDIIKAYPKKIINLHISYLPYNRGADPNFWSFIDNTPKGVTIHYIDEGIDTGDILVQKRMHFNERKETLRTSYEKLHKAIQKLFKDNWEKIKTGKIRGKKQKGKGSYHKKKELLNLRLDFSFDTPIYKIKEDLDMLLKTNFVSV